MRAIAPALILIAFLLVGAIERPESSIIDDFEQTLTVVSIAENATPQPPEFDLSRLIEKRVCIPLTLLRDQWFHIPEWPEGILAGGVEFILSLLDCRRLEI